ncbi:MAG: hypothetical protein R3B13_22695 [Polyangiaceae bacterium]
MTKFTATLTALAAVVSIGAADARADGALRSHAPIQCHKSERIVLEGVRISAPVAVNAHGNCDVLVRNSELVGSATAIDAHGNANVRLENTRIVGSHLALDIHGNADVHLKNSRVEGKIKRHGNGDLDDQGGNQYSQSKPDADAPKPAAPATDHTARGPVSCMRGEVKKLTKVRIDTDRTALDVSQGCTLVVTDSQIVSSGTGLRVRGGGTVTLLRTTLKGGRAAVDIAGGATVRAKDSKIEGKVLQRGGAVLVRD